MDIPLSHKAVLPKSNLDRTTLIIHKFKLPSTEIPYSGKIAAQSILLRFFTTGSPVSNSKAEPLLK